MSRCNFDGWSDVIGEVPWCLSMQTTVRHEAELESNPLWHVQPVQFVVQECRIRYFSRFQRQPFICNVRLQFHDNYSHFRNMLQTFTQMFKHLRGIAHGSMKWLQLASVKYNVFTNVFVFDVVMLYVKKFRWTSRIIHNRLPIKYL